MRCPEESAASAKMSVLVRWVPLLSRLDHGLETTIVVGAVPVLTLVPTTMMIGALITGTTLIVGVIVATATAAAAVLVRTLVQRPWLGWASAPLPLLPVWLWLTRTMENHMMRDAVARDTVAIGAHADQHRKMVRLMTTTGASPSGENTWLVPVWQVPPPRAS